jgi:hypothetical protein
MHHRLRALRTPRTALPALLGAALSLLLPALPAPAQAATWQCRGSVLSATVAGNTPSEPLVANSGFAQRDAQALQERLPARPARASSSSARRATTA